MTNNQLLKKLSEDMKMRNFSHYTYDAYMGKTREMIRYFNKPMEKVTMEELRYFLYQHLLIERKLADRSINYYNSIIRFVYEVTLDRVLNKKQLPMRKKKRAVYKVLTREELGAFFNCVDDFKFKTIFMLAYGAGLRIGEIANLRVEDIDSKTMRIFVREGKGNKERYTILPEETLKMLRIYWTKYRQNRRRGRIFLSESGAAITVGVMREHFRQYRRKAKLSEKVTMHTLRHCFATNLKENKDPRDIFREAVKNNASSVILVHNHPSGITNPSTSDIYLTNKVINLGKLLGIKVIDHVIIGKNNYYSFLDNYKELFDSKEA